MNNTCQHCKGEDDLMVNGYYLLGSGAKRIVHMCRKCNTERCRKYRSTDRGALMMRKAVYRSIAAYPERHDARMVVNGAIRSGIMERPETCARCCRSGSIQAHHEDYSKPLEVKWMCRQCHADTHRKLSTCKP